MVVPLFCRRNKESRMIYQKYFKSGQKVQLRAKQPRPPEGRNELLSATLEAGDANHFDLSLPYGPDSVKTYPFTEDMPFELSADTMGLGIKVTVTFLGFLGADRIRVLVLPDLQMFQRRAQPRLDCTLAIRYTRGQDSLQAMRKTWEKHATELAESTGIQSLEKFHNCDLNLSCSGIRLPLQPPVGTSDIYLLLLALADRKPPICALAEIIWVSAPDREGLIYAGMQFINILEQDQKRITSYIRANS